MLHAIGTIIMFIIVVALIAFMTVMSTISKILGNGTAKAAAGGLVGYLLAKYLDKKQQGK